MKRFLLFPILAVLAGTLGAQTANVIEVEPAEAARAKLLYTEMLDAQKDWADFQAKIGKKYLERPANTGGDGPCEILDGELRCYTGGSNRGFEWSANFKYLVPKQEAPATPNSTIMRLSPCVNTPCTAW